jgi:DNA-directed RNA polymerase specialized sigma24 family protein
MLIKVRGITYPSVKAASEALGVSIEAVYSALSRGSMDKLGLGNTRKKAVEIEGLHFSSMCEASLALGFSRSYLRTALTSGSERVKDRVYRAARKYKRNLNKEDLPL